MDQRKKTSYSLLSKEFSKIENPKKINNFTTKRGNQTNNSKKDKAKSPHPENSKQAKEEEKDPNIPDRSYGDYYCTICDSHMNSEGMWEDHVTGKRHLKNVKKGNTDSKYEELSIESDIKYQLRNVKDPVVGLSYIHEIRRKDTSFPPYYNCFLCHGNIATVPLVIEHVLSLKHRLNYIKENEPLQYNVLHGTSLRKDQLEPLAEEIAMKLEQKNGRGEVLVKQEKPKKPFTGKRSFSDDDDDDGDISNENYNRKPVKNLKSDMTSPYVWKAIDSVKAPDGKKDRVKKDSYSDDEQSAKYSSKKFLSRDKKEMSPGQSSYYSSSYKKRFELNDHPKRPEHNDHPKRLDYNDHPKRLDYNDHPKRSDYNDHQKRSDYNDHQKRSDYNDHPKRSDYNVHPKRSDYDDHPRKSEYNDDYFQQTDSYKKGSRSPKYERQNLHVREQPKKTYSPVRSQPEEYNPEPSISSYATASNLLPHEIIKNNETKDLTDATFLKNFLQQILELPNDLLLKIFLIKMESMDIKATEELSLLSKIIVKGHMLLTKSLPSELQEVMKQRFQNSINSTSAGSTLTPSSLTPALTPSSNIESNKHSKPQDQQSDISFIKDILNSVKNVNSSNSVNQNTQYQTNQYVPQFNNPSNSSAVQNAVAQQYQSSLQNPHVNAPYQYGSSSVYQNVEQPYNSYSSVQGAPPGNYSIPGLTLSGVENAEPQPYNNYLTSPPKSYETKNYPYQY